MVFTVSLIHGAGWKIGAMTRCRKTSYVTRIDDHVCGVGYYN